MNREDIQKQVDDLLIFCDDEALEILNTVAQRHHVPLSALAELLAWERELQERKTAHGRGEYFDLVFDNRQHWGAE